MMPDHRKLLSQSKSLKCESDLSKRSPITSGFHFDGEGLLHKRSADTWDPLARTKGEAPLRCLRFLLSFPEIKVDVPAGSGLAELGEGNRRAQADAMRPPARTGFRTGI